LFTKNGGLWLEKIAESNCDAIGLDWQLILQMRKSGWEIKWITRKYGPRISLLPIPKEFGKRLPLILKDYGSSPRSIFLIRTRHKSMHRSDSTLHILEGCSWIYAVSLN